jgi:hypothetical protein
MSGPLPVAGYVSDSSRTQADLQVQTELWVAVMKETIGGESEYNVSGTFGIALSSHILSPVNGFCVYGLLPQSGSSDQLNTIVTSTLRDGQVLYLRLGNSSDTITIINGATGSGHILTFSGANIVLTNTRQFVAVKWNAALGAFEEIFPATNLSAPGPIGGTTPSTGSFTSLTLSTPLSAANGGTGSSSVPAQGSILIGNSGGTAYTALAIGSNHTLPISNGSTLAYGNIASANFGSNTLAIANGGTNATTASAGFNNLSPITTAGDLIIGTGVNTAGRLAIGANNTLPISTGTTLAYGNIASANFGSNTLAIANGGTNASTASAGFNNLSPITTTGDLIVGTGTDSAGRLAIGANHTLPISTGTTLAYGNIASANFGSNTLAIANGGTNAATASAGFNNLSPITTTGDLIIGTGANTAGKLAIGANNTLPISTGTTLAYSNIASANFGSNTLAIANGGTNASTASAGFNNISPITTAGDIIIGTGVDTAGRLAIGANNTLPISNGSTLAYGNLASANFGSNILAVANGGTGAATATNPSWFGCSGSTTPAFQSGQLPNALVDFAAPGTIGSTTANTGAFTTLGATGAFTQSATAQNQGPLANNGDYFTDWLVSGYTPPSLPTANLTCTFTGNTTLISQGCRVYIASGSAALSNTYTASKDTYVDMSATGVPTYTAVANNASPPSVASGCMRLAKVVSGASTVTGVSILAPTTPMLLGNPTCQGRLYVVSGSPYADGISSGNSTLYFGPLPDVGNQISLGSNSSSLALANYKFSEVSLALSGLTAVTMYDVYVSWSATACNVVINSPVAWSTNTTPPTRATGSDGRLYKNGDFTQLYVGSFLALNATTLYNFYGSRDLWNMYNRRPARGIAIPSTSTSYVYGTASWRLSNNNTAAGGSVIGYVTGLPVEPISAWAWQPYVCTTAASTVLIGLSTDGVTPASYSEASSSAANFAANVALSFLWPPQTGYHYYGMCENVASAVNTTFFANSAANQGMQLLLWC